MSKQFKQHWFRINKASRTELARWVLSQLDDDMPNLKHQIERLVSQKESDPDARQEIVDMVLEEIESRQ